MANFNTVTLVGRLTRDIELKQSKSGSSFAIVGIAVNDRRKVGDEWVEEPNYIDIMVGGKTAELAAKYLKKGSSALFSGRLRMDSWENSEGQKQKKLSVVAEIVQFLDSKQQGDARVQPEKEYTRKPTRRVEEEIPF